MRRDLNTLLSLAGRHLVWPLTALGRLREFLQRRCKDNELWSGHDRLGTPAFMERYGIWRGPYEEGTLFFYLDEYAKDAPKDVAEAAALALPELVRGLDGTVLSRGDVIHVYRIRGGLIRSMEIRGER